MSGWTCRRVSKSIVCGHLNRPRTRKCQACGKPRPARRRPAHMAAFALDYDQYVELNGGEWCGICRRKPTRRRRLDRDHDHTTHAPRGLLCARCNRALPSWVTAEWLRAAASYLERDLSNRGARLSATTVAAGPPSPGPAVTPIRSGQ